MNKASSSAVHAKRRCALGLALTGALLVGCFDKSADQYVADAKKALAKQDNGAAVIQLKNALESNPSQAEARFLLGKTSLQIGDVRGAIIELEKAKELGYPADEVIPELAKALLAAGMAKKVVELEMAAPKLQPQAEAALKAEAALAEYQLGDLGRSKAAVEAALKADPQNVQARLVRALHILQQGQSAEALALTDAVIADAPKSAVAWSLKGEILFNKGESAEALKAYQQSLALDSRHMPAYVGALNVLRGQGDVEGFRAQLKKFKAALPQAPLTLYFSATLALMDGDLRRAREESQQLLRLMPDDSMALTLAGTVEVETGQWVQGRAHLTRATQMMPAEIPPRQMLAVSWLKAGQPAEALAVLKPLLELPQPAPQVLSTAAAAYLQSGDADTAQSYYRKATAAAPNLLEARIALAMLRIGRGEADGGIADLDAIAARDAGTGAEMALLAHHLARNDLDASLKVVARIEAKKKADALPHLLRGRILRLAKNTDGARASFNKALELQPTYFPAVVELAKIDIADGKPDQAVRRYEDALRREPKNAGAMLALADLKQKGGAKPDEIETLLEAAVAANPVNADARLVLINYRLSQRRNKEALAAATDAVGVLPNDLRLLEVLGRSQLAAGDGQQAVRTFRRLADEATVTPDVLLRLAAYYRAAGKPAVAGEMLQRAAQLAPANVDVARAAIEFALPRKQYAEGVRIAREMQKQRPKEPVGYLMEAGVLSAQKDWDAALKLTRTALEKEPGAAVAVRLHALYLTAGRRADAEKFAAAWTREHPADADFLFHLGSMALERKDYAEAEDRYRAALALRPDSPLIMNNIAWVLLVQHKQGAAELARRAVALAPDEPAFNDTLSRVYQAERRLPEALMASRKAMTSNFSKPEHRLQLARLLIESGDRAQARVELDRLAALGSRFSEYAEVRRLQAGL